MRTLHCLVLVAAALLPALAMAGENDAAIAAARRQLEMAQLKLRLYERDEYPRQLGQVERTLEMQRAKLESFRRRVREYEQYDKWQYSAPLFATLEDARLDVLAAELRLRELEDERFLLIRSRSDRSRMLELEIDAAAAHFNALVSQL
jgi:hypothetical protein